RPVARVGEARVLARHGATAMIDVSDGLTLDLSRLAAASSAGAAIWPSRVPVAEGATMEDALGGGEDYELMAALPPRRVEAAVAEVRDRFGVALTAIGEIRAVGGLVAMGEDGEERALEPRGWEHFGR